MSAAKALQRFMEKAARRATPKARKTQGRPEKAVQLACVSWMRSNGFAVNNIEAKGQWSPKAQRFLRGPTDPGVPDILGTTPQGYACACEIKAPGRKSTLRTNQRLYLVSVIERGGFGVCTDSVADLEKTHAEWTHRRAMDPQLGRAYLLRQLPQAKDENTDDGFLKGGTDETEA